MASKDFEIVIVLKKIEVMFTATNVNSKAGKLIRKVAAKYPSLQKTKPNNLH